MLQIHHLRVKSVVKLSVISFVIALLLMLSCFPAFAAPAPEHSEPGTHISSIETVATPDQLATPDQIVAVSYKFYSCYVALVVTLLLVCVVIKFFV